MSIKTILVFGNDTIDPYPLLIPGEAAKILCVTQNVFLQIQVSYRAFCRCLLGRQTKKSFNTEPSRGQNSGLKVAPQTISPKSGPTASAKFFRDFEPSNTIYLQYSDIRRWRRVNEWFNQYAHEATEQIFQKTILIE